MATRLLRVNPFVLQLINFTFVHTNSKKQFLLANGSVGWQKTVSTRRNFRPSTPANSLLMNNWDQPGSAHRPA